MLEGIANKKLQQILHCSMKKGASQEELNREKFQIFLITRLYSVKTDIFKNAFFWYFFIRNDLSRVDLIIKMVLEFLSNL